MLNRRDFLRNIISAGISFGFVNPCKIAASIKLYNNRKTLAKNSYALENTIFCQFNNEVLKTELEKCAERIDCNIWYGEPFSPDILAVPYFISIVDRNIVGKDIWETYVSFCDEVNDDAPCLIVDNIKYLTIPKTKYVSQFDLSDYSSIIAITHVVTEIKVQEVTERNLKIRLPSF